MPGENLPGGNRESNFSQSTGLRVSDKHNKFQKGEEMRWRMKVESLSGSNVVCIC